MRRAVQHHLAGRVLLRHRVRRGHGLRALLARPLRAVRPDHAVRRRVRHRRADHVPAVVPGRALRHRQVHRGRPLQAAGRAGAALCPARRPVEVRICCSIVVVDTAAAARRFTLSVRCFRYFKLFLPVDLRYVKFEVRDLCMLRLLHAFCESMPLLLLQSYLLWTDEGVWKHLRDLNKVAVTLSTISVCWALASFGKNVRMQNVHRLVLTWLGVIFQVNDSLIHFSSIQCIHHGFFLLPQFLWRLGTVGARVISLTAYAAMYRYWVLLVIVLHWLCVMLWLHSPKNVFHGERMSPKRKVFLFALLAFVYTFEYVNLLENNHREKMVIVFSFCFLVPNTENLLELK